MVDIKKMLGKGNPIIIDGTHVIFFWQGNDPPGLIADFNDWNEDQPIELTQVGKALWIFEIDLPPDGYFEYTFFKDGQRVPDPANRRRTPNGLGKYNYYFYMPEGHPTPYFRSKAGIPTGEVTTVTLAGESLLGGKERKIHFYNPPVDQPAPLLVVWDGKEYLRRAHLATMVDRLIHEGKMQPVIIAMVENHPIYRFMEYSCTEATIAFLTYFLLPYAHKNFRLTDPESETGSYGVAGASLGGLMALYTALRLPHIFGKVLSQSGAFSIPGHDFVVWDLIQARDTLSTKIWMDCGKFEGLLEPNQRMEKLLFEKKADYHYQEYHGGHNYPAWRNELPDGLEYLFGC